MLWHSLSVVVSGNFSMILGTNLRVRQALCIIHRGEMCRRDSTACMQQPALSRRLYFQSGLEQGLNLGVGLLECALDILFAKEYLVERPCHNLADFN